jgi:hypothetical protein
MIWFSPSWSGILQELARMGRLKPETLRERYYSELRPNLTAHETRHDLTLQLWPESYWPARTD